MKSTVFVLICALTAGMAIADTQNGVRSRISPVPVYLASGILPSELLDQYVFLRMDGRYIVSYPESLPAAYWQRSWYLPPFRLCRVCMHTGS